MTLPPVLAGGDLVEHLANSYEIHFGGWHWSLNETINFPIALLTGGKEVLGKALDAHGNEVSKVVGVVGGFNPHLSKHVVMMLLAVAVVCVAAIAAARRASRPKGRGLVGNCMESVFLFLRDEVVRPNLGEHHARAWLPWFATVFFFILACNLLGLLPPPLGATATGNWKVTAALALLTFFATQGAGMAAKGPLGYWVHLVPPGVPWWMWPLVWVIEFAGLFTKPFALTVRLFANMTAGHVILGVLGGFLVAAHGLGMTTVVAVPSVAFALFIMLFELLVALIQAYIFTTLSSIFVGLAVSHEH